ncbi:putative exocyst complex component EXO70B1 [Iris pallida]|uniref:Exocyst subunit Exo70 family protein n=1 Tax=Iris pallida TaxID=29817 RepID=A0AAX6EI34_IRIPA|nr:putative exocyst complex component EXO70B1 [Iris pallida]
MAENGEEKLMAVARHIARTLGRTDTMADDILDIFTTFDGRFSREKLSDSSPDDRPFSPVEQTLNSLDRQISRFALDRPIWSDSASAAAFLTSVDTLLSIIRDVDPPLLDRADDLLHRSMLRLEDEFRWILDSSDPLHSSESHNSDGEETDDEDPVPVANPVTSYDIVIDAIPPGSVSDLRSIAERVVAAGFSREIAQTYSASRRDFLDESLSRLGVRRRTDEEVQSTPWNLLEDEIQRWVRAANLSFRVLFPSERRLCDKIFSRAVADLAFVECVHGSAVQLLEFADSLSAVAKSPERLFRVIDMYEILRDLLPEIDPPFADQFYSVYKSLGSAIRGIFMELENLIRRDPANTPVPGGGLHPITRYVMNYLRAACGSRRTLEEVMEEDSDGIIRPSDDLDRMSSSLSVQIAWILEVLQGNLEAKSKIYKDPALSLIFLMNNRRYIINKAKDSELVSLMGEDWIRRQSTRMRKWAAEYQKATWSKVVVVLKTEASTSSASGKAIKDRFRVFNTYLEEIWKEQKDWVVADEQLKEELRVSAAGLLIPTYRNFVGRWEGVVGNVKYGWEDVEMMIDQLFEGSGRRR